MTVAAGVSRTAFRISNCRRHRGGRSRLDRAAARAAAARLGATRHVGITWERSSKGATLRAWMASVSREDSESDVAHVCVSFQCQASVKLQGPHARASEQKSCRGRARG